MNDLDLAAALSNVSEDIQKVLPELRRRGLAEEDDLTLSDAMAVLFSHWNRLNTREDL